MNYPEKITITLTVDDVLWIAEDSGCYTFSPQITRQEAARVLHEAKEQYDAAKGITTFALEDILNDLYGDRRVDT